MFDFTSAITLTGTVLYGTVATDMIPIFGVGLLVGRNVRVVKRYRRINEAKSPFRAQLPQD